MPARLELAGRAEALAAAGTPFVWATVVRAERPTSAKPGDSALVLADGQVDGFVGGDCAESTVRVQALEVLATATPRLLRITPSAACAGTPDAVRGAVSRDVFAVVVSRPVIAVVSVRARPGAPSRGLLRAGGAGVAIRGHPIFLF